MSGGICCVTGTYNSGGVCRSVNSHVHDVVSSPRCKAANPTTGICYECFPGYDLDVVTKSCKKV